jgi:hypothetical protein
VLLEEGLNLLIELVDGFEQQLEFPADQLNAKGEALQVRRFLSERDSLAECGKPRMSTITGAGSLMRSVRRCCLRRRKAVISTHEIG